MRGSRHHGTRLLPHNPVRGVGGDRCAWIIGSGVWEVDGGWQVHEKYSRKATKWSGVYQGYHETVPNHGTGAIYQKHHEYVRILFYYFKLLMSMYTSGERKLLSDVPNALSYQRILETATSGYLVRQYIHSSLYDRMRYVCCPFCQRTKPDKYIAHGLF